MRQEELKIFIVCIFHNVLSSLLAQDFTADIQTPELELPSLKVTCIVDDFVNWTVSLQKSGESNIQTQSSVNPSIEVKFLGMLILFLCYCFINFDSEHHEHTGP